MRYIPWLPFQRVAKDMRADLDRLYDVPFGFVKREMVGDYALYLCTYCDGPR